MAASVQLNKMSVQHHRLLDYILANRTRKNWRKACCEEFGISQSWLSIVMNSDCFRERFEQRRQLHDQEMAQVIVAKQAEVGLKALQKLDAILDDDEVEDRLVADVANNAMKNLGLVPSRGVGPQLEREYTRIETQEVSPGVLMQARTTYRSITSGEKAALPSPDSQ